MLSTLSSFLPPVLQLGSQDKNGSRLPDKDPERDSQEQDRSHRPSTNGFSNDMSVDEHGLKKRKERTHESFIVVRPPPAKSNHPLNLQVQLVPPTPRDNRITSSRRSIDSTAESTIEDPPNILSRTSSSRSDTSVYTSGFSSVTSFSTVASTSSSTSTRRMIIPLYNLQAHNVLTNVVVDAGTDAKIAKFQRRGLEIIGLAMLEPVEVWAGASFDSTPPRQSEYLSSTQQQQQHPSLQTPTSSALSLTSDSHTFPESLPPNPSTPTAQQEARGSARKFIGKIFRRKGADNPSSSPSYNTHSQPSSPFISESTPRSIKRSSLLAAAASTLTQRMPSPATANFLPGTPTRSQNVSEGGGSGGGGRDAGRDAGREGGSGEGYANATSTVLGIQPILNSPVIPPKGKHPKMYVWVVRRWLKGGNLDGIFSGLTSLPGSSSSTNGGQVEVRFEWTRSKGKKEKKKEGQRERKESLGIPSNTPSTSSLSQLPPPPPPPPSSATAASLAKLKAEKSTSAMRKSREGSGRRSVSPNPPASVNTHTTNSTEDRSHSPTNRPLTRRVEDEDPGEESDSEDSETPWTCTLTLRPSPSSYTSYSSRSGVYPQHLTSPLPSTTSQSHSQSQHPQQPPQHEIRIKVGAVVPTPHHPKVVSLLKIPFPLPDIEVDKVVVRKRVVTPAGVARPMLSPVEPSTAGSTKEGEGEGGGENRGFGGFGGMRQGQGSKSVPMSPFGSAFGKGSSGGGGGGSGGGSGGGGGGTGIVLTAEEIKDVVCCTGLWLVVREGFGGVGKEKRKGDGWRIRG